MMDDTLKHAGLIFMKVGLHAQESIEDIIKRKQREYEEAGSIFWGYGGSTCHPVTMVQPFAKAIQAQGQDVLIVMQKMNSKHAAPPEVAKEYSDDGVDWKPIPKGIEVRGSRFALVLDELRLDEFEVDLGELAVGVGPSRGKRGDKYLINQADKGCFVYSEREIPVAPEERVIKSIGLVARVKSPFAVFVRN
ncbi:hypothetical protein [Cupriavidus consociatus]|uniref:hypothetical protein n=1 Tax=Cupriavidus consociatus TaxID=2821357 RepID=UPI001AE994F7|nr:MULTISPECIES: hypothetical protein [unclassified Cupriavidus]MBP0624013.1 hypothetical protein [Cupriavidus sp. LEh25]MDK2660722.1 hypothetical protein [Cupriavidus sp. LEh21]